MRRLGFRARGDVVPPRSWGRWLYVFILLVAIAYLLWSVAPGARSVQETSREETRARLSRLETEKVSLESRIAGLKRELDVQERQLQIERATNGDLVKQVKALTNENASMKEDVALLQAISSADTKASGVKLSSVRVEPNSVAGEYSYSIVFLQTGGRRNPFRGRYQMVVNLDEGGKRRGVMLPASENAAETPYRLTFRVHQRVEGTFKVNPAAVVQSVQVRVFEDGQSQPKVMHTVTLS